MLKFILYIWRYTGYILMNMVIKDAEISDFFLFINYTVSMIRFPVIVNLLVKI